MDVLDYCYDPGLFSGLLCYHTLYIEFLNLMARKLIVRKQREVGNMASVLLIT